MHTGFIEPVVSCVWGGGGWRGCMWVHLHPVHTVHVPPYFAGVGWFVYPSLLYQGVNPLYIYMDCLHGIVTFTLMILLSAVLK